MGKETGILGLVTYRSTEGGVSRGAVSIQFDLKSQDEIDGSLYDLQLSERTY